MLKPIYTNRFLKDYEVVKRRGLNIEKLKEVINKLVCQEPLDPKLKDHSLLGNYANRRECHIEPNWLLIYKTSEQEIIFERTGSHSDLFR